MECPAEQCELVGLVRHSNQRWQLVGLRPLHQLSMGGFNFSITAQTALLWRMTVGNISRFLRALRLRVEAMRDLAYEHVVRSPPYAE
eukprot:2830756-Amphidinium_carterae.2